MAASVLPARAAACASFGFLNADFEALFFSGVLAAFFGGLFFAAIYLPMVCLGPDPSSDSAELELHFGAGWNLLQLRRELTAQPHRFDRVDLGEVLHLEGAIEDEGDAARKIPQRSSWTISP